jgi:3D (Asp-Asp-Asp) domain-containing protein
MRNCSHKVGAILLVLVAGTTGAYAGKIKKQEDRVETRVESIAIPSPVQYQVTREVGAGRLVKHQTGKAGAIIRTYEVTFEHGKPVSKHEIKEERADPSPTIFYIGKAGNGWQPSRGNFMRHKVLDMNATAYDPSPETIGRGATGRTCTGLRATFGMVAVDPRVIPLGTLVYVEGYGLALACDRGSAIKGNRIDLCYDRKSVADAYGRHKHVRVHILN